MGVIGVRVAALAACAVWGATLVGCAPRPTPEVAPHSSSVLAPSPAGQTSRTAAQGPGRGDTLAAGSISSGPAAPPAGAPGAPWTPPSASPSAAARRVLDSLPDPASVPLPEDLRGGARAEGPTAPSGAGCYEVQLEATADSDRAQPMAGAAAARLGVSTRVVGAGGLYRIRAGGCLDGVGAARLRDRARAEGYPGAFVTPAS